MKKLLLATTMLAGTAGFAAAEVSVTGWAEIGVWKNNQVNGNATAGDDGVAFWQDVEIRFIGTGSTDTGLEFGAQIDLDETDVGTNEHSGTHVWVSGAFGKLTMGDTDGAIDWALADMDGGLDSIADDHTTHAAWFGGNALDGRGDGQILRYENTFGQVAFAISLEQGADGLGNVDDIWGIGVKYNADLGGTEVGLGLAYQDSGDIDGSAIGVSAKASFAGGFGAALGYIDYSDAVARDSHTGVEVNYTAGALGLNVNYGKIDFINGTDADSWGAAVNYDLGGGAKVAFGYGSDVRGATTVAAGGEEIDQWSLGLRLDF